MKEKLKQYQSQFSESAFWNTLRTRARKLGVSVVYAALLLYYAYRRKETPPWAKRIVLGVLGYLLMPLDMLPDLTPIIGYTDDVGMLSFGIVTIAAYINADIKAQAREQLRKWFGDYDENDLTSVDDQL